MVLFASCSRADFVPLSFNDAPWHTGEASVYSMSNSSGEAIGTAQIDIAAGTDAEGNATWNFRQELAALNDEQLSVVEMRAETLRPTVAVWTHTRPEGVEVVKTTYNGAQAELELTNVLAILTHERVSIPSDVRDDHTIAVLTRALPLAVGYATRINTFLPVVGITERVEVAVEDEERIEVPAGAFDVWRVNLSTETVDSTAWIGKEAPYPLVRFEDDRTDVNFELVDFQPSE